MDIKYVIPVGIGETGSDSVPRRFDMAKERFTWLAADTFARSKGGRGGAHLEQGKAYDAADFEPAVVGEWVRAGAAEWVAKSKVAKEAA